MLPKRSSIYTRGDSSKHYSPECVEWGFSEVRIQRVLGSSFTSRAALSLSWCSEVFLCYSAHTFTLNKSTLRLLRELWTPREGSGQRPGSLLHTRVSYPSTTATTGKKDRPTEEKS